MRVPVLSTLLLTAFGAYETPKSAGAVCAPPAVLVFERTDAGVRAEGRIARRLAVYADGSVLATRSGPLLGAGHLDATRMRALAELVAQARLPELPDVLESRASWCELGDASSSLRWSALGGTEARVLGDLRQGSADRALAPHGFVEVIEYLEAIPIESPTTEIEAHVLVSVEFTVEPWSADDASPFEALLELEPLHWPSDQPPPRGNSFRAAGTTASTLFEAARLARPVLWRGTAWRLRANVLFPHESGAPTAAYPARATRHG
jgi:hypothetical protein